jgi:hypothetical protein
VGLFNLTLRNSGLNNFRHHNITGKLHLNSLATRKLPAISNNGTR